MRIAIGILATVALLLPGAGRAQPPAASGTPATSSCSPGLALQLESGYHLEQAMKSYAKPGALSELEAFEKAYFVAYIAGVHDALAEGSSFCVPDATTTADLASVVAKYISAHPGSRKYNAAALVAAALRESYSCPKKRTGKP